jgi:hypothetical protein
MKSAKSNLTDAAFSYGSSRQKAPKITLRLTRPKRAA